MLDETNKANPAAPTDHRQRLRDSVLPAGVLALAAAATAAWAVAISWVSWQLIVWLLP
ncbi:MULTISPECIES: hypothetical protein [unclassified Bradyrhizobium]|uniref:hypothetical protein n=1 Tax=unclassified Bradyrhizobium TaxID=2631580 RepID=UPI002479CC57|nr:MULTISPECIES: hypothetical protein [unclassified Bradyrhizobium]WGR67854.1 hypothetical protein MTX24_20520 [Bradyrhizobium sp. ISRA426]WGR79907.1 hypothetical protein MTX21_05635 [Bradyrhizobium sp. ISRA430]WGR83093.1 hypothetical protein MTX25_20200 [Bradyrhizobium sp. ISRA432]